MQFLPLGVVLRYGRNQESRPNLKVTDSIHGPVQTLRKITCFKPGFTWTHAAIRRQY